MTNIHDIEDQTRTDTHHRKVGTCPACRDYLWADCTITTTTQKPYWRDDAGSPQAIVYVNVVAMTLHHDCDKRGDDQ